MKKTKKCLSVFSILIFLAIIFTNNIVLANEIASVFIPMEYTEAYKEYLNLSDEERSKVLEPRAFQIIKTSTNTNNPFKIAMKMGNSLDSKYTLKNVIPENLSIRNQEDTAICWAFAMLSSLETNLALKDYNNKVANKKVYDFSERHMDYATTRVFADNQINSYGFNRKAGTATTWNTAITYLTNGLGAIDETSMKFENNDNLINISEIQNKKVTTEVYDTIDFPSYKITEDTTEIKKQMKEHIKNYGSVATGIHGAQILSDYYNNDTRCFIL